MNKLIGFRVNSEFESKINQMKNKSEFINNLIANYYNSEKKSNEDITTKLTEKISELENNIVKNNLEINKEIINMLMQIAYSTKDQTTVKNCETSFDNSINLLKN